MNPIDSWLDPAEVRRLAELLLVPAREPEITAPDAGFDRGFEGFASARPAASVYRPAAGPTAEPVVYAPPAQPDPLDLLKGPLRDRVLQLRNWLRQHFAAHDIFLLDREGAVIFDETGHGKLHFLARSLALSSRRPGASFGNVHIKVSSDSTLEVIPADTPFGCLVLGVVVREPISPAGINAINDALVKVATPPSKSA
jgi:hypothetical protein